jgi:hypothetical protein
MRRGGVGLGLGFASGRNVGSMELWECCRSIGNQGMGGDGAEKIDESFFALPCDRWIKSKRTRKA